MVDASHCALFVGDNVEVMRREIPDGTVQLTVTSPPYDNLRTYNGFTWNFENVAREIFRVTKPGGVLVWIVGDATVNGSETGSSFTQALYLKSCGFNLHDTMVWDKGSFSAVGSLTTRYAPVFEYMFVFVKGKLSVFNPIKDKPNKWHGRAKIHGTVRRADGSSVPASCIGNDIPEFGQRHNIWTVSPERNSKAIGHPAMFPEKLARDHIVSWSNVGDLVCDPFLGSGTTAKASLQESRRFVGCDISPQYVEIARQRVEKLFSPGRQ